MDRPALMGTLASPFCERDKSRFFIGRKFAFQNGDRHERARKAFGKSLQAFNHVFSDRIQRETLGFTDHECWLPAQPKKRVALVPRSEIELDLVLGVKRQLQ